MFFLQTFNFKKAFPMVVLFFGTMSIIKLWQDKRYSEKDLKKLTEAQIWERDSKKIQERFKLSDIEMDKILAEGEEKKMDTTNLIEVDPDFQHKRAE